VTVRVDRWTENSNVYAVSVVHLSTGSVMKSALDSLIDSLEQGTWKPKGELSLAPDAPTIPGSAKLPLQETRTCWHCRGEMCCGCSTCASGFLTESGECMVCKGTGQLWRWIQ
jgi:hypothetical protein